MLTDGGVAAIAEFWDPGIEWRAAEGEIDDAGEMHGREAVRRYAQDWFDMFDDLTVVEQVSWPTPGELKATGRPASGRDLNARSDTTALRSASARALPAACARLALRDAAASVGSARNRRRVRHGPRA
jgi:hypothetical protein